MKTVGKVLLAVIIAPAILFAVIFFVGLIGLGVVMPQIMIGVFIVCGVILLPGILVGLIIGNEKKEEKRESSEDF